MFSMKGGKVLPVAAACAVLSTLAACGGGDPGATSSASGLPASPGPGPAPAPTPAPTPTPTPAPTPAPTPTPAPPPPPPSDPAPPTDIVLEPGYTDFPATLTISKPHWLAWSHTGTAVVDGVGCAPSVVYHIHALLSIYQDRQRLALPDSIGRGSGCNYEMHTHDGSGVMHIETNAPKVFTLGQFFALWGAAAECHRRGRPARCADVLHHRQGNSEALHGRSGRHHAECAPGDRHRHRYAARAGAPVGLEYERPVMPGGQPYAPPV